MDYYQILFNSMIFIGLGGLYSLRYRPLFEKKEDYIVRVLEQREDVVYTSKRWWIESFKRNGYIIGFSTLVYKNAPLFLIPYIVLEIIASSWYSPFLYIGLGFVISVVIGRILSLLKILSASHNMSSFGLLMSAIITCAAIYLLLAPYF